ncbi:hypothetical protein R3P38DRAFT_3189812 [Favolaschia claudopus]|uniref:Uncharacterized protein n=1 Tax=Favolaschia claudopus TaxID=2862362 RepID=A0AAW0BP51_9AGAR
MSDSELEDLTDAIFGTDQEVEDDETENSPIWELFIVHDDDETSHLEDGTLDAELNTLNGEDDANAENDTVDTHAELRKQWTEALSTENKLTWVLPSPFQTYAPNFYSFQERGPRPLTVYELKMCQLSWILRSKPDWRRKAGDPEIRGNWRREALEQQQGEQGLTEKMVDYVLAELEGYASIADFERGIEVLYLQRACFEATWYSDTLITTDICERLKSAVKILEDVHEDKKDLASRIQQPSTRPRPPILILHLTPLDLHEFTSRKFSWLPSDFAVDDEGEVKLSSSYINNLDPSVHQPIYTVIEEILTAFIPLFERVLGDSNRNREDCHIPFSDAKRLQPVGCIRGRSDGQPFPGVDEDEDEFYRNIDTRYPKGYPEAQDYTGQLVDGFKPVSLRGRSIQCIVKLANIHLTTEQPRYEGGSWHVEGMVNERIVASGIYYYDEENITESRLSFRVAVGEPEYHGQSDGQCMRVLYNMSSDSDLVQHLGSVVTKEGRTLSWPNLFQHCVSPFELADSSKPGHRKILAIFLVDPSKDPVISATHVPPQQEGWAAHAFEACVSNTQPTHLGALPRELLDLIKENFPPTLMSLREAEGYRLELMKERTASVKEHSRGYVREFNMCEH